MVNVEHLCSGFGLSSKLGQIVRLHLVCRIEQMMSTLRICCMLVCSQYVAIGKCLFIQVLMPI
jgi:hypothetical protein